MLVPFSRIWNQIWITFYDFWYIGDVYCKHTTFRPYLCNSHRYFHFMTFWWTPNKLFKNYVLNNAHKWSHLGCYDKRNTLLHSFHGNFFTFLSHKNVTLTQQCCHASAEQYHCSRQMTGTWRPTESNACESTISCTEWLKKSSLPSAIAYIFLFSSVLSWKTMTMKWNLKQCHDLPNLPLVNPAHKLLLYRLSWVRLSVCLGKKGQKISLLIISVVHITTCLIWRVFFLRRKTLIGQ